MVNIDAVAAFSDNYIWLLHDDNGRAAVVDPGDAGPVKEALQSRGLELVTILITHHHFDHVGGLSDLAGTYQCEVIGPHNPGIDGITRGVGAGDQVEVLDVPFDVLEVPGHTLDHIAFFHGGDEPLVFCGDTLFAGGCGRVFEGDPPMMHNSLQVLAALPPATRVYCAHEYTLANLAFAKAVEPANEALQQRIAAAEQTRQQKQPTVPSSLELELATNPFLRCDRDELVSSMDRQGRLQGRGPVEVFAAVRGWKDNF